MTIEQPPYETSSLSGPLAAARSAMPSSSGSPATTASRLTGVLAGVDTETWNAATEEEAQAALGSVAAYCRDYCPVRLACAESACRLYRLEGRALAALGYARDADTEAVGVLGQPLTGLGL